LFRRYASPIPSDIIQKRYGTQERFFLKNHPAKIFPWGHIEKPKPVALLCGPKGGFWPDDFSKKIIYEAKLPGVCNVPLLV